MKLPPVSDHAVLRFLARVEGLDVEALRRRLARATAVGIAHGAPAVIFGRAKLVIRGGVCVTVLPRNAHTAHGRAVANGEPPTLNELRPRKRRR